MTPVAPHQNGHASPTTLRPITNGVAPLSGIAADAHLFALFATIAREAGRDDLHAEFTRRAASDSTHSFVDSGEHSIHLQQLGCRLLRSGKLTNAETAFRQVIKLDPTCVKPTAISVSSPLWHGHLDGHRGG